MPPRQTVCALRECWAGAKCSRYLLMKACEERRQTSWYDNKLGVDTEHHSTTWNPSLLWSRICKWQSHFRVNAGFSVLQCWFTSCITMVMYALQPTSRRGFCVREGRYIDLCLFNYYCFQPVGLIPAELHWLQLPICQNARLCLRTHSKAEDTLGWINEFNVGFNKARREKDIRPLFKGSHGHVQCSCSLFGFPAPKWITHDSRVKQSQIRIKTLGRTQSRHKSPADFTPTLGIHVDSGTTKTPSLHSLHTHTHTHSLTVWLCVRGCANPVCKALKQQLLH